MQERELQFLYDYQTNAMFIRELQYFDITFKVDKNQCIRSVQVIETSTSNIDEKDL